MGKFEGKQILLKLWAMIFVALFASCTGTIEDSELETTEFGEQVPNSFNYQGLVDARAVAHNKFEVDIRPYRNDLTNYIYELYVNEGSVPIIVDSNNLSQKVGGVYTYTVTGLLSNYYYSFKLRAKHVKDGTESAKENVLSGIQFKTFDNQVASFGGVGEVSLVPGASSSSIKVKWTPGVMEGVYTLNPADPAYYEVKVIKASLGLENLNNPLVNGVGKIVQFVPDTVDINPGSSSTAASPFNNPSMTVVTGLEAGTSYYVQVRAVHKNYYDALRAGTNPIIIDKDSNTLIRTITTTDASSITDIPRDSLILTKGSGANAYSRISASWLPAEGNFTSYRIYYREYDTAQGGDQLDPMDDIYPELEDVCEADAANDIQCLTIASDKTNGLISLLSAYKDFQVKVAVCQTDSCPVRPNQIQPAVFTEPREERTEANLVDFAGIGFINHPNDPANTDQIKLDFDPVVLGDGFADSLDLVCVDPDNSDNYIAFPRDGSAIAGSSIANCDGLSVVTGLTQDLDDVSDNNIESVNQLIVRNVNNINTSTFDDASYCFALNPAIRLKTTQVFVSDPTSIVRCISPEIAVPSQEEFVGLKDSCVINIKDAKVSWSLPTDGVYNKFQVYWKEKDQNAFSFEKAIAQEANYSESELLTSSTVNYTFEGEPGKVYEVGALAIADDGTSKLYSEYNLGITTCTIPMPEATFNEWTRVIALGPKIDGRIPVDEEPSDYSTDKLDEAFIFEQITERGMVIETKPSVATEYEVPPGNYDTDPISFSSLFDGKSNSEGYSASNKGIISLAWKAVVLDSLQTDFDTAQDLGSRDERTFGYRVYRSTDNRVSWTEVTDDSGLLHQGDYTYFLSSSDEANKLETEKMVFFTDYSVSYSNSNNYTDRARIYWYRVVPVYNDRELTYSEGGFFPPNEIKVVLPPPNVALVSRKMANRQGCLSLGKSINKSDNYSCDYNGIGSVAKSVPWSYGQTKLDLNGDLFIDRNELGCQYTRGSRSPTPNGTSSYYKSGVLNDNDWDENPTSNSVFKGLSNSSTMFVGCVLNNHKADTSLSLHTYRSDNFDAADATYRNNLFGDCYGVANQRASSKRYNAGSYISYTTKYNIPAVSYDIVGFSSGSSIRDVHYSDPDNFPDTGLLDEGWQQNLLVQSEAYAVFYNLDASGIPFSPHGPDTEDSSKTYSILSNIEENGYSQSANGCFINLSAIGTDNNWKARWFPTNHLDQIDASNAEDNDEKVDIYTMTIDEVKSVPSLYNSETASHYKPISNDSINSLRVEGEMPISRIFSANHAKLPPLSGLTSEQYNKVCSTYAIQVGIQDSDSGGFIPLTAPKKKRLPRRNEIIASSEYSEFAGFYDSNNPDYIVKVEKDQVSLGGGCNGTSGNTGISNHTPGLLMQADDLENAYFTGSSHFDGSKHSELCVSKYGVQDLIGNLAETESQKLFCDFSLDKLYLGRYTAGIGEIDESIEIPNRDQTYFLNDVPVYDMNGVQILPANNWLPYEVIDVNSGYCSVVDSDATRIVSSNNFRNGNNFIEVFNPDGTPNEDIIYRSQGLDQAAVSVLRNGDGTFLNFAADSILPQLKSGNEVTLTNDTYMAGKYFSPIVGLPLSCDGSADYDPCGEEGGDAGTDNTLVSTQKMIDKHFDGNAGDMIVHDVNGSNILPNFGTERVDGGPDPADQSSVQVVGVGLTEPMSFATSDVQVVTRIDLNTVDITADDGGDGEPIAKVEDVSFTTTAVSSLTPGNYVLTRVRWRSDRAEPVRFKSGGDFTGSSNGKYTLEFHQQEWDSQKTGRCSVLINTDDL